MIRFGQPVRPYNMDNPKPNISLFKIPQGHFEGGKMVKDGFIDVLVMGTYPHYKKGDEIIVKAEDLTAIKRIVWKTATQVTLFATQVEVVGREPETKGSREIYNEDIPDDLL